MYHELFEGQEQLPYHIFLIDAETEHTHAHTELEICFLLCGEASFRINNKIFPLYEHDFIIVNPLALHQIQSCSDNCRVLFLHIDLFSFQKYISGLAGIPFTFSNTMNNRSQTLYQMLYQSLRNILNTAFKGDAIWRLAALQEIINILSLLFAYYQTLPGAGNDAPVSYNEHNQMRMLSIIEYLNKHWKESLTLASVASAMDMSPSYFSRFFKNNMGTGFLNYLTQLRLKHSINLLLDTQMPVIEIAYECGFNDYKTFGRLFKKEFGDSPQVYRKTHTGKRIDSDETLLVNPEQIVEQLILASPVASPDKKLLVSIKLNLDAKPGKQVTPRWNHTITIGNAENLLRHKIQEHVLYASGHLPLQYIRFSGMLSDNMHIYHENHEGVPCFSWEYLNEILDFLNKNQLSPFIILDYMPELLSAIKPRTSKDKKDFFPDGQTSVPKSMENLQKLIQEFTLHIHKYSTASAPARIQLWSFPEASQDIWTGTEEQFFNLIKQTYFTIRKTAPGIQIGSPSSMGWQDFSMLKRFLQFCKHEKMDFDFFCLESFGFTSPLNKNYPSAYTAYEKTFPYQDGEKIFEQSASLMAGILLKEGFTQPVIVTEWGINPYINDLSRDTSFMSAWITEQLLHLPPCISEICYCLLTDNISLSPGSFRCEFIGGQGLLTHSGIPKPSFAAFEMLELLGPWLLASGKDYIFTRNGSSWQLLIYNYSYYSGHYLNGRQELLFDEDRYNIYENSFTKVFQIQLGLVPGKYQLETIQVDREHYAPYDEWIKMGKPELTSAFYHQCLMNKCFPGLQTETVTTSEHLQIQRTVPAHGITIIKINRI